MSCCVGRRHVSDLALLWLWRRLAAIALICPPAWKPPYAMGAALKQPKKKKKKVTIYIYVYICIICIISVFKGCHEYHKIKMYAVSQLERD